MNNNNSKRLNLYTQVQPWAVRVLLIVGLVSGPVNVLAGQGVLGPFKTAVVALVLGGQLSGVSSLGPLDECPSGDLSSCPIGGLRNLRSSDEDWHHDWERCQGFFSTNRYNKISGNWWDDKIAPMLQSGTNGTILVDFKDIDTFEMPDTSAVHFSIGKDTVLAKILGCIAHNNLEVREEIHNFTMVNLDALSHLDTHSIASQPLILTIDKLGFTQLETLIAYNMAISDVQLSYENQQTLQVANLTNNDLTEVPADFKGLIGKIDLVMTGNPVCEDQNIEGIQCLNVPS